MLRVDPPGAERAGLNLSLGIADLSDLSFVGRINTNGEFLIEAGGVLTIPAFKNEDGTPIPIEFFASIDNDRFVASGTLDLTGQTIVLGDDPTLLEITDCVGTIDLTIPLDGGPISGGLLIEAGSAAITPDLAFNAIILGDNSDPENPIPGLSGSLDFQTGAIQLDLHRFQADLGGIIRIDALPTVPADPFDSIQPAVRFSFDPAAAPTDDLLLFGELTADFTALPAADGQTPSVTLDGFGLQHDGTPFLTGASLSIPAGTLASLGIPDIIDISEIGISSSDGSRLSGDDLVNLDFDLNVSAALNLPDLNVRAEVRDMKIRMNAFNGGDVLAGITFGSVEVAFETPEGGPVQFGPVSVSGGFRLESFDPTPCGPDDPVDACDADDANSIIIRVSADVQVGCIGIGGQFLITEYGPIAAGLSGSFGETGIPLGPVVLYEAGAMLLFNESVPDLPLNDPLRLIEPGDGGGNEFDLSRFRRDGEAALLEEMNQNARDYIVTQRAAASPEPTWTTPFLFTLSGTFGPAGQPKSTAAFLADVTIGANIDPSTAEVLIFGLGEAFVGPSEPLPGGG